MNGAELTIVVWNTGEYDALYIQGGWGKRTPTGWMHWSSTHLGATSVSYLWKFNIPVKLSRINLWSRLMPGDLYWWDQKPKKNWTFIFQINSPSKEDSQRNCGIYLDNRAPGFLPLSILTMLWYTQVAECCTCGCCWRLILLYSI